MNGFRLVFLGIQWLLVWGLSGACLEYSAFGAEGLVNDRFLKEAPRQWLEYRKITSRHSQGTYKTRCYKDFHAGDTMGPYSQYSGSFILNLDRNSVRRVVDDASVGGKAGFVDAEAFNPDYRFEVRPGGGKTWVIHEVMDGPSRIPDDLIGRSRLRPTLMGEDSTFNSAVGEPYLGQKLWAGWVPLLVSSPDFKLIRATYVGDKGQLVEVEFQFEPKMPTGGNAPNRSGKIVLDPARFWLVCEAETAASYSFGEGSLKITNEFSEFADGDLAIPYVSRQVMHVSCPKTIDGKAREDVWTEDVEMHAAPNVDAKQFTLSAFGLPEPQVARRKQPWFFPAVFALLLLTTSLFAYRRWRTTRGST